ncbi:MAG: hypothetical protein HKM95_01670, partial [Inquilinus sp.]|nr:hypothetical protein [Inquilinus sp.]
MTGPQDQPPTTATGGITDPALATDRVVAAFGGIRPMAQKLGTPVTTVQGWKKRGHIPEPRHPAILAAAGEHKIDLDAATLAATAAEGSTGTTGADAGAAGRGARVGPEAEPPRRPSPAAKPPQVAARAGGSRVPGLALGLAAIALIGTVSAPFWTAPLYRVLGLPLPVPTGGVAVVDDAGIAAVRDRLNAIERRLGDLAADAERGADDNLLARIDTAEARLAAVEQIATPALADRLLAIDGALDALASDLARLDGVVGNQRVGLSEARTALTGLESDVEELATALGSLADAQARDSLRIDRLVASDSAAQAFVLAIGQLRAAVDTGRPYDQTLAALRGLSAGDPDTATDLSALVTMSGFGIPTRERLKAEFPAMAAAARE